MRLWPDFSRDGMGVACFGGDSKPAGTTTTNSAPWINQQPYLNQVMGTAAGLYDANPSGPAINTGQVAGFTPQQSAAMGQQYATGMQGGTPALQAAAGGVANVAAGAEGGNNNTGTQLLMNTANGSELNPMNNPAFQQMAQTTLANTMPSIEGQFAGAGRMDSGLAARAASQGANDAIGGLAYQDYQQGLQNQLAAATTIGTNYTNDVGNQVRAGLVAPSIDAQTMSDYGTAAGVGAEQQQQNQAQLNAGINQSNYNAQRPYNALGMYGNMVSGNYGSSTSQPYFQNGAANTLADLSGALGIANSANGLFGSTNAAGNQVGLLQSIFR